MHRLAIEHRHPLGVWYALHGLSDEQVSTKLKRSHSVSCCPRYVRQISNGTRIPSYRIAKALSAVTCGEVSVTTVLEWRRPGRKSRRRSKQAA